MTFTVNAVYAIVTFSYFSDKTNKQRLVFPFVCCICIYFCYPFSFLCSLYHPDYFTIQMNRVLSILFSICCFFRSLISLLRETWIEIDWDWCIEISWSTTNVHKRQHFSSFFDLIYQKDCNPNWISNRFSNKLPKKVKTKPLAFIHWTQTCSKIVSVRRYTHIHHPLFIRFFLFSFHALF